MYYRVFNSTPGSMYYMSEAPHPQLWQPKMSTDIDKRPLGAKSSELRITELEGKFGFSLRRNIPTETVLMKQTSKMESFEVDPVGSTFFIA